MAAGVISSVQKKQKVKYCAHVDAKLTDSSSTEERAADACCKC